MEISTNLSESEKHRLISEAAFMFVAHHKAYKKIKNNYEVNEFLKVVSSTQVETYLTRLIEMVDKLYGTQSK